MQRSGQKSGHRSHADCGLVDVVRGDGDLINEVGFLFRFRSVVQEVVIKEALGVIDPSLRSSKCLLDVLDYALDHVKHVIHWDGVASVVQLVDKERSFEMICDGSVDMLCCDLAN